LPYVFEYTPPLSVVILLRRYSVPLEEVWKGENVALVGSAKPLSVRYKVAIFFINFKPRWTRRTAGIEGDRCQLHAAIGLWRECGGCDVSQVGRNVDARCSG
jgi:hypothetical protein